MKLFGKEISFFGKPKLGEKFKAGYDQKGGKPKRKTFYPGEVSWAARCKHYDEFYEAYPLFRQGVMALAGLVMSQGVFLQPAVNKKDETYALAEEAVWRVQNQPYHRYVNSKFYQTVWNIGKYGGCFWEVTDDPVYDWHIPTLMEYIEPYKTDAEGNIIAWRQYINGQTAAEWSSEDMILISWNVNSRNWPFGTSLGLGCETEMEILVDMETSAKDYMDKEAWPYEILALGDGGQGGAVLESEYTAAKTQWSNRKPGQGIVTRNMPVDIIPGGTGSSPIRELSTLCQLMKDNVHDGIIMPPLSKLYNSTEASAKVMTRHVMTIVGQPIQWALKEVYEEKVLKRWLEHSGFSRKSCPKIMFESPDVHKTEEGEYWALMVERQIQTPKQACEHLGLEYDEEYWTEQQKREEEQMMQKQQKQEFGKDKDKKTDEVWEVRKKQ